MKRLLFGVTMLFAVGAQASCYSDYQHNLQLTEETLVESGYYETVKKGKIIGTAMSASGASTAFGALPQLPTGYAVSVALTAGGWVAGAGNTAWMSVSTPEGTDELLAKRFALNDALALLKEARVADGPILQKSMAEFNRTVGPHVSILDVSNKIVELDENREFCPGDVIATPGGILDQTVEALKQ